MNSDLRPSALRIQGLTIIAVLLACTLETSGCQGRQGSAVADRLAAASQALAATGDYEIVATDPQRGLLTVRSRQTGGLQVIDLSVPATATTGAPNSPAEASVSGATHAPALSVNPAVEAGTAKLDAAQPDSAQVAAPAALPGAAEPSEPSNAAPVTETRRGEAANGPGVLVRGPNILIERAGKPPPPQSSAPGQPTLMRGTAMNHALICRGDQHLRLQQMRIQSQSAGIVLQSGCQLELVDSEVHAGDVALIVNSGATLRIENSIVRGCKGSVQANGSAHVASWASTFTGPKQFDAAQFDDQGGNVWQ